MRYDQQEDKISTKFRRKKKTTLKSKTEASQKIYWQVDGSWPTLICLRIGLNKDGNWQGHLSTSKGTTALLIVAYKYCMLLVHHSTHHLGKGWSKCIILEHKLLRIWISQHRLMASTQKHRGQGRFCLSRPFQSSTGSRIPGKYNHKYNNILF